MDTLKKLLAKDSIPHFTDLIAGIGPDDKYDVDIVYRTQQPEYKMGTLTTKTIPRRSWWETVAGELVKQPTLSVDELMKLYK